MCNVSFDNTEQYTENRFCWESEKISYRMGTEKTIFQAYHISCFTKRFSIRYKTKNSVSSLSFFAVHAAAKIFFVSIVHFCFFFFLNFMLPCTLCELRNVRNIIQYNISYIKFKNSEAHINQFLANTLSSSYFLEASVSKRQRI